MSNTVSCGNCEWTGSFDDVNDILDFEERMSCPEGGIAIMPAGECPECGCLAYYDQDSRDWPVHLKALDLLKALKQANILIKLLTVRQVIDAGDDAISAAGLNPWCINEGRAQGDEKISVDWIDRLIQECEQ